MCFVMLFCCELMLLLCTQIVLFWCLTQNHERESVCVDRIRIMGGQRERGVRVLSCFWAFSRWHSRAEHRCCAEDAHVGPTGWPRRQVEKPELVKCCCYFLPAGTCWPHAWRLLVFGPKTYHFHCFFDLGQPEDCEMRILQLGHLSHYLMYFSRPRWCNET